MYPFRVYVDDAEGKRVRVRAGALHFLPGYRWGLTGPERRAVHRAVWGRWWMGVLALFVLGLIFSMAPYWVYRVQRWDLIARYTIVQFTLLGLGVLAWVLLIRPSRAKPRLVEGLLRTGHCPRCLYDVSGIDARAERTVTCPECGAVWERA